MALSREEAEAYMAARGMTIEELLRQAHFVVHEREPDPDISETDLSNAVKEYHRDGSLPDDVAAYIACCPLEVST